MFRKPGGCPHCGDKKLNKVKFADPENKKFPIDTPENIKAAWKTLHEEKNKGKYPKNILQSLEEKIINAWKLHIGGEAPNMDI